MMESIFHRTSVRQFLDKDVDDDKINLILKAAMAAPSAGNQQPWEFYVTKNKEILEKLADCSPYASCVKNAPMAFIVCYRENVIFPEYAQIDSSIASQNILLAIDSLGLGGVWLGIAPIKERMEEVRKVISLPCKISAFSIIPCGYPAKVLPQQDRYDLNKIHYIK